jgi:hypothetical protein
MPDYKKTLQDKGQEAYGQLHLYLADDYNHDKIVCFVEDIDDEKYYKRFLEKYIADSNYRLGFKLKQNGTNQGLAKTGVLKLAQEAYSNSQSKFPVKRLWFFVDRDFSEFSSEKKGEPDYNTLYITDYYAIENELWRDYRNFFLILSERCNAFRHWNLVDQGKLSTWFETIKTEIFNSKKLREAICFLPYLYNCNEGQKLDSFKFNLRFNKESQSITKTVKENNKNWQSHHSDTSNLNEFLKQYGLTEELLTTERLLKVLRSKQALAIFRDLIDIVGNHLSFFAENHWGTNRETICHDRYRNVQDTPHLNDLLQHCIEPPSLGKFIQNSMANIES